jgi:hypothetical protein
MACRYGCAGNSRVWGQFIASPIIALLGSGGWALQSVSLAGALIGIGIPEYPATRYQGRIKGGCILLPVHADSKWLQKAKKILGQMGAADMASFGETKGDYANTDKPGTG